jgi:Fe2+ or Zn2+ uptake regulation protein
MSENVTIIFYPYIYNNKIDFAGKETYTYSEIRMDVLSKTIVTVITKGENWRNLVKLRNFRHLGRTNCKSFANLLYLRIVRKFAVQEETVEYKTQARQMILDYMAENPDRIFKASGIAQNLPEVSLSTIYRNLARMEKAGVVQIVGADDNNELQYRYTGPGRCEEKMHLVCKECGKFFHLEGPALKVLQLSVQRSGFELDQQQSVLLGRCSGCSRRRHD